MGRKTNSVSLRLKKTNRDYNHCWYGDILYANNFSKSLEVSNYLSQTFKTLGIPCPQISVIGAFKKANLLVCYLDPKKRKRLLEKVSKSSAQKSAPQLQREEIKQNRTKAIFSLGQENQNSNFLFKPLQEILETNMSKPYSFQNKTRQCLGVSFDSGNYSTNLTCLNREAKYSVTKLKAKPKYPTLFYGTHKKGNVVVKEKSFIVENANPQNPFFFKKKKEIINNFYWGSLGLELLQFKESKINPLFLSNPITTCNFSVSIKDQYQESNDNTCHKGNSLPLWPLLCSFNTNFKISLDLSLKGGFFLKPHKKKSKISCNSLELKTLSYDKKNILETKDTSFTEKENKATKETSIVKQKQNGFFFQKQKEKNAEKGYLTDQKSFDGLKFLSHVVHENISIVNILSRFPYFSMFFYNERNYMPLVCAFSKNSQIFGKDAYICQTSSKTSFSSKFVFSTVYNKKNISPILVNKELLSKKKHSKTSLYHFYNNFSCFWDNVVSLSFYKSTNETSCALFLADTVSYFLEKKVLFRNIKRQLLVELNQPKYVFSVQQSPKSIVSGYSPSALGLLPMLSSLSEEPVFRNKKKIIGVRIVCSGRVGGRSKKAQRSRKDTFMWGETGLHVFSSKLDFAKTHAETPFGAVGVQVWVCTK